MTLPNSFVTVARILRARGNKGEVAAELLTDFPDRLKSLTEIFLATENKAPRQIALKNFWIDRNHPGQGIFHFEGVNTISDAETLRGLDVQIPASQRVSLPAGQYFVTDLIGCAVFEIPVARPVLSSPPCALSEAPTHLGTVRDVYFPGEGVAGTPLLAIDSAKGELLLPLAEDICTKIDTVARRIEVVLPEGLRDLNAG